VDRHLAVTGRSNRLPALHPVPREARLRCDPDQAAAVEQNALDHRGVWLDYRESAATTLVTARMDTPDALDLDGSITDLAGLPGRLGDHRHRDVRRACALGMLACPQRALDLAAGTGPEAAVATGLNGSRGTLYLHVSLADLAVNSGGGGGRVERLGSTSLVLLRDWLQRVSGWANLACLCRRHHRAKTFAGWRYRRIPEGSEGDQPGPTYEWTSPPPPHLPRHPPTPLAEGRPHAG
jgi:hypothetical protein